MCVLCPQNGSKKTGVAVVPGSAFALDPQLLLIRFSCAVDLDNLRAAMDIIEEAVVRACSSAGSSNGKQQTLRSKL